MLSSAVHEIWQYQHRNIFQVLLALNYKWKKLRNFSYEILITFLRFADTAQWKCSQTNAMCNNYRLVRILFFLLEYVLNNTILFFKSLYIYTMLRELHQYIIQEV